MEYVISFIKEFEGIIGALLGVIITMLMNEYLKSKGKIKYYFDNFVIRYMATDNEGCYGSVEKEAAYESIEYEFNMQIYNTSESKKILREIKIQFISDELEIETTPKDSSTSRKYGGGYVCDSINIININPKEILEISIEGYIDICESDIKKLKNINKVFMLAKDSNDKTIKKLIKDYSKTS
ncbi:MAG: hypothetical protein E6344_07345 [Clostridium sp.]|nr:hypothetical protein [Clostridium sp.]MDU7083491.1 hypothetical protein [Clostridium sp.]